MFIRVWLGVIVAIVFIFWQPALAKDIVIERTYSVTRVSVPQRCELDSFRPFCVHLVNYYARRFEREIVMALNENFKQDNMTQENSRQKQERSEQIIKMYIHSVSKDDPVFTLFSIFEQNRVGAGKNLLVETINFDMKTGRSLDFSDLFKKPELAAMLCARAIEAEFSQYKSPLLPVVIAATELQPSNFLITPRGLRFFFAPSLVRKDRGKTESMLVPLDQLKAALPHDKWWQGKDQVITQEQRERLAQSKLSAIITLEEQTPQERLAQAHGEDVANTPLPGVVQESDAAVNSGSMGATHTE